VSTGALQALIFGVPIRFRLDRHIRVLLRERSRTPALCANGEWIETPPTMKVPHARAISPLRLVTGKGAFLDGRLTPCIVHRSMVSSEKLRR